MTALPASRRRASARTALRTALTCGALVCLAATASAGTPLLAQAQVDSGPGGRAQRDAREATVAPQAGATATAEDQQMIRHVAQANLAEIETGRMAQERGASAQVKAFGKKMMQDHTDALDELRAVARRSKVQLPSAPDEKHRGAAARLMGMKGKDFDDRYMQMAVADHQETLQMLQKVRQEARDEALRAYAEKTIPVVSHHLDDARRIAGKP